MPSKPVGHSGFAGIRMRFTVVLLDADRADAFLGDFHDTDGYDDAALGRYGLTMLGSFEVPTLGVAP